MRVVEEHAYYVNKRRAKTLVWKKNLTSNCDVTNSAHQIQMTSTSHWMKTPIKIFCVRHWVQSTSLKKGWKPLLYSTTTFLRPDKTFSYLAALVQMPLDLNLAIE